MKKAGQGIVLLFYFEGHLVRKRFAFLRNILSLTFAISAKKKVAASSHL